MLDPDADTWHVDLRERSVLTFTIDYRVSLHLHGESGYDGLVILELPFEVRPAGEAAPILVDPARKEELAPVLTCFEKVIETVTVSREHGSLTVTFTDGSAISAASHDRYEAWEVNAPGVKVVALPGGGKPALWLD